MTQQTIDNSIKQAVPLLEFVDSVFCELKSWQSEDSSYYSSKKSWNDTLIPLAVRLYELAKDNDEICWWLLQKMSRIELCKDGREFRKTDLFDVLTRLKQDSDRLRMMLKNCQLNDAEELQQAIEEGDINSFRNTLSQTDGLVFDVGRVLRRAMAISDIYKSTVGREGMETMAELFWLIRRSLLYFAKSSHRSCDGMAYNLFVALNISMYREYAIDFCDLLTQTGSLWVDSLMTNYFSSKDQYPQAVSQAVYKTLHGQYPYGFNTLKEKYDRCDNDEQKALLNQEHDGCLKLEKYSFVYDVLESGPFFPPPFDWKKWRPGGVRIMKRRPGEYRYPIADYLLSDWIPMEKLEALATSEEPANVEVANGDNGSIVNPRGHLYPESEWGFIPDDYFELKPSDHSEEYFDREQFEEKYKAKGLDHFAELINYLAEEKGCVPNDDETKALLAYRLTGLNRPAKLKIIPWTGITSKDSPLELYYLVKHWVVQNHKKNPQCEKFFVGPLWIKKPSQKVKDCNHDFQRKLKSLFDIPTEYK